MFLIVVITEMIIIQKLESKYIIERKKGIALSIIYLLYTIKLVIFWVWNIFYNYIKYPKITFDKFFIYI